MKTIPDTIIKWTRVKDALPDNADRLLVVSGNRIVQAAYWNGTFRDLRERKLNPTLWAYWPELGA